MNRSNYEDLGNNVTLLNFEKYQREERKRTIEKGLSWLFAGLLSVVLLLLLLDFVALLAHSSRNFTSEELKALYGAGAMLAALTATCGRKVYTRACWALLSLALLLAMLFAALIIR
jgi:hypothetical protein